MSLSCEWLKISLSLTNGIKVINYLDETKFEHFLNRIVAKLKTQRTEIFSKEEKQKLEKIFKTNENDLVLCIKTTIYLVKRMLKHIFMPSELKSDLEILGLNSNKAEAFVKVWSSEISNTLNEMGSAAIDNSSINFTSEVNAELSSDISKKSNVPKGYLSVQDNNSRINIEMNHPELYSMFRQLDAIQQELDSYVN